MGSALPLIAIYLYSKFYLNATSSFKFTCQTRYRPHKRTDKAGTVCLPFGDHKNVHKFCQVVYQGWERGSVSPTHEKDL